MKATYGQLVNGKKITFQEFEKEVAKHLNFIIPMNKRSDFKLCKTLYNKGYSVSDTVSFIILKNR